MIRSGLILGLALLASVSAADDGWVADVGGPAILGAKHPTIRMKDETVNINVGKKVTSVSCLFHFVNSGPACDVGMGFPDDPQLEGDEVAKTIFNSFTSWVDGKPVVCHFKSIGAYKYWQVKTVHFGAKESHVVRDDYTVNTGEGNQGAEVYDYYATYILHTGNTWKGNIGSVKVNIRFDSSFPKFNRLIPLETLTKTIENTKNEADAPFTRHVQKFFTQNKKAIFWKGPRKPTLKGHVLKFSAKNLRPTDADDIFLSFSPHAFK